MGTWKDTLGGRRWRWHFACFRDGKVTRDDEVSLPTDRRHTAEIMVREHLLRFRADLLRGKCCGVVMLGREPLP